MRIPARAPIAKAASVQAVKATSRRSNTSVAHGMAYPAAENGRRYQENSTLNAAAAAATATPSVTSLPSVQRHRPKPWVQANRKVPVSISRASTGAPANAPITGGTTCRKALTTLTVVEYLPMKFMLQASELAGWQETA